MLLIESMSAHKVNKSYSETNGLSQKRNLLKQEEIDLTNENLDIEVDKKNNLLRKVHTISICINSVDEPVSEMKMGQDESPGDTFHGSNSSVDILSEDLNRLKVEECDRQPNLSPTLPQSNDLKDKKRSKHLVRCEALRESSLSPPPAVNSDSEQTSPSKIFTSNHLTVYSNSASVKNSPVKSGSLSGTSSPSLSRESSTENSEMTTSELQAFFVDTLKKPKDRMFLLRIDNDLRQFVKDSSKESQKLMQSSSYNRMLIHRLAAYFGLEHAVDPNHTSVVVSKTKNTRIPEVRLKDLVKDDESTEEPKKSILKRDSTSLEDSSSSSFDKEKSPEGHLNGSLSDSSRSRSLEEREEHYERVRARIFNEDLGNLSEASTNQKRESDTKLSNNASSPLSESQIQCDTTNVKNTSPNNATQYSSEEVRKKGQSSNYTSRPKHYHSRNKFANEYPKGSNRFPNHKSFDSRNSLRSNDSKEWNSRNSNFNKFPSQSSHFNLACSNSMDGHFLPRFPWINSNVPNVGQFSNLMDNSQYPMGLPLTSEQLCQPFNYLQTVPLLNNQVANNVPNYLTNQLNYNNLNGVNPALTPNNLPMPNNYSYMFGSNLSASTMFAPGMPNNAVPHNQSATTNLSSPLHTFNPYLGVPYQQQFQAQSNLPMSLLPNLLPNVKNDSSNLEKNYLKAAQNHIASMTANQASSMNPALNMQLSSPPVQFAFAGQEQFERQFGSVPSKYGDYFKATDRMLSSPYLNYGPVNKRYANEGPVLGNKTLLPNQPLAMPHSSLYLNSNSLKPAYPSNSRHKYSSNRGSFNKRNENKNACNRTRH